MKKISFLSVIALMVTIASCNNQSADSSKQKDMKEDEMKNMKMDSKNMDSTMHHNHQPADTTNKKETSATNAEMIKQAFSNIDTKVAEHIKLITDYYLQIKNALIDSNGKAASKSASLLENQISDFNKLLLTPEQKKIYDEHIIPVKEDINHIKLVFIAAHQRGHLPSLSGHIYALVKAFGTGGNILYYDHCPMANENKGAGWLSETRQIKNPYFGKQMLSCGSIKEILN